MNNKISKINNRGQAMVLVTIMIGTVMATTGVIAGLLTFYELRQANDSEKSAMSFYAADAGVEKTLLCYFTNPGTTDLGQICDFGSELGQPEIILSNSASAKTDFECVDSVDPIAYNKTPCDSNEDVAGFVIKSFGLTHDTERILETFFATKRN